MPPTPDPLTTPLADSNDAVGRRRFLKGTLLAGLFMLSPAAAQAATKTTKKTTKTTKKATTKTVKKAAVASSAFSASDELAVSFTFATADGGFRVHNPYVAVFIEDAAGALVRTIDLSIESSGKGLRYLHELHRWYRAANGGADLIETMSSATRVPGTYSVVWDGRDEKKVLVPKGDYYVCIEASRERGPYEIIREPITIGSGAFTKNPVDSGELQGASVALRARS